MEKWGINVIIALIGVVVDITGRHDYLAMVYPRGIESAPDRTKPTVPR
jgi:hypothetical protein